MHEATVEKFLIAAKGKVEEAQSIALQVPDDLGGIQRTEIVTALKVAAAAMAADVRELRGDVAAAHAFMRRCRFPRDEHSALFGVMAEIGYALAACRTGLGIAPRWRRLAAGCAVRPSTGG